jgi:hypothetical protein
VDDQNPARAEIKHFVKTGEAAGDADQFRLDEDLLL